MSMQLRWFRFQCTAALNDTMEFWMNAMRMHPRQLEGGTAPNTTANPSSAGAGGSSSGVGNITRVQFLYEGDDVGLRFEYVKTAKPSHSHMTDGGQGHGHGHGHGPGHGQVA